MSRPVRLSDEQAATPQVGMGATLCVGGDRYPYTIVKVGKNGATFTMQADDYKMTHGSYYSEDQEYSYEVNPQGEEREVRLASVGIWRVRGGRSTVILGVRQAYRDPSF